MRLAVYLLLGPGLFAADSGGPCTQYAELLKRDRIVVGVRTTEANARLAKQFMRAMDFWASIIDLQWHPDNSSSCGIEVAEVAPQSLISGLAAQADNPRKADFRGLIRFDRTAPLSKTEMYYYSVHEIGHLLGLLHNPSPRSVMYFEDVPGPERLDKFDLTALAKWHRVLIPDETEIAVDRHGAGRYASTPIVYARKLFSTGASSYP